MNHILLLEDDATLGQGIRFALENSEARVTLCSALSQEIGRASCRERV